MQWRGSINFVVLTGEGVVSRYISRLKERFVTGEGLPIQPCLFRLNGGYQNWILDAINLVLKKKMRGCKRQSGQEKQLN